jgi:hypothetical protein
MMSPTTAKYKEAGGEQCLLTEYTHAVEGRKLTGPAEKYC